MNVPSTAPFRAPSLFARKGSPKKITALTAYDYTTAVLLDGCGVDLILVGDSLGHIVQGNGSPLPVTLDEMIYHSRCVTKGVRNAMVVGDLPFLSYQISPEQALLSAGRLVKEGGVHAVKLEGGLPVRDAIAKIASADLPVIGHIGLTPQSLLRMGGYKVQGRQRDDSAERLRAGTRERIIADALAVEEAGASAVVLEGIPSELSQLITEKLTIPTIGIGAGPHCDGQILVTSDLLGMTVDRTPKFVKRYAELGGMIRCAVTQYLDEVRTSAFPTAEFSYDSKQPGQSQHDGHSQKEGYANLS